MRLGIKLNVKAEITPILEIGDDGRILSEEFIKRGNLETFQERGQITFLSDGSKCLGTREVMLGEATYRVGKDEVKEVMFLPYEYFSR